MDALFRSVSFWQSALMTLPDGAFFDLLRSVLGTIKTPFNKQNLIEELSRFIIRPEIQENIASYIDSGDRRIIAAIALLSEPAPGELESFFTGEYSYVELQGMLLNLEERLIIYRFRDTGVLRIALNPRLENILAPIAANKAILFPSIEVSEKDVPQGEGSLLNNRTLAVFFSFLFNSEVQLKDEAKNVAFAFRRKAAEQSKLLFPGLDIVSLTGGLLTLGLLVQNEEKLIPDEKKIADFKALSDRQRIESLTGAIALFLHRGILLFQGKGLLKNTVRLIHDLYNIARNGRILPEATMIKLAELRRRQKETNWSFPEDIPPATVLLRSLVLSGLFLPLTIDGTNCYRLSSRPNNTEISSGSNGPCIAMDSGFSCILYPEISFADALDLAAFSSVEETGTAVRVTLSRDSVIGGFNRGYSAQFLWQLLERLSGSRVPDTLKWNIDDWEKRWNEISLNEGVVLSLGKDRSYLAQTEPIVSMIKRSLAPGVFLLSAKIEDAVDALRSAGVDIIGRPKNDAIIIESKKDSAVEYPEGNLRPLGSVEYPEGNLRPLGSVEYAPKADEERIAAIKNRFLDVLEKMDLSKQEREELESRIDRRMVVSETQLKDTSLRYEKLEARSLDYVGKTGIVKQAIASGSVIEVSCLNGEKILGFPESLDKKGGEMILFLKPREGGSAVKLALGKISLIRRIKQSIFGT